MSEQENNNIVNPDNSQPKPAAQPSTAAPTPEPIKIKAQGGIGKTIGLIVGGLVLILLVILIGKNISKGVGVNPAVYQNPATTTSATTMAPEKKPTAVTYYVSGDNVRVRAEASFQGKILGYVSKGSTVEFTDVSTNVKTPWKQVKVSGQELTGWVHQDFLKTTAPTAVAPVKAVPLKVPSPVVTKTKVAPAPKAVTTTVPSTANASH